MSSNTLGNTDFNAVSGVVLTPKKKAILPKNEKLKLAENQPDKFERTTPTPRKTGEEGEATFVTPEPQKDVLPLVLGAFGAVAGVSALAVAFFKKPAEGAKVVDEAAQKEIKNLKGQVTDLTDKLAEKASKFDLEMLESKMKHNIYENVKDLRGDTKREVDHLNWLRQSDKWNLDRVKEDIGRLEKPVREATEKLKRAEPIIQDTANKVDKLVERLDATVPVIGNNIAVSPEIKDFFTPPKKLTGFTIEEENAPRLQALLSVFNNEATYGVPENGTKINTLELLKESFTHLKTFDALGDVGEMKRLATILPGGFNSNEKDSYRVQLKAFQNALAFISQMYEGELGDNSGARSYLDEKTLVEKANEVMSVAKTGDVDETKQAQAELMTWLEGIFTKTRVENFNANTEGKNPIKTLPPAHADSTWVKTQNLFADGKPLEALTQTLLGKGFKGGAGAEHPDMLTDANTLENTVIPALQRSLVKEHGYTRQNGMLVKAEAESNQSIGALVKTINAFAKSLIPITEDAIEAGQVPLRVKEGKPTKDLSLATHMWNARLEGSEDDVKAVTTKMFEEVRSDLATVFFEKNKLIFSGGTEQVIHFLSTNAGRTDAVAPDAYETITIQGANLPQGTDFVQTVINQFFDGVHKSKGNMETLPQTLHNFYQTTYSNLTNNTVSEADSIQQWKDALFSQVLEYAGWNIFETREKLFDKPLNALPLATWEHFPELKEKVQAVIRARTESVDAVKAQQTELMAFLKDKFYKPEPPPAQV